MNEKGNKLRAKTTSAKEKQTIIQQILDEVRPTALEYY
jgi:hypothetical protein